jgi:integrase
MRSSLPPVELTDRREKPAHEDVSLSGLIQGWWKEAQAAGLKPSTYESYRHTFSSLIAFLGHDNATRVTKNDVVRFKDHRLTTPSRRTGRIPSAKTVKDSDLSALKAVFGWAVVNLKLTSNPAEGITIRVSKPPRMRSKGFTDAEANAILKAALEHQSGQENPKTTAAKRWVPWLCAFTGARVGEVAQLRKEDVTERDGHWIIRITPEAGTVKTNEAREVAVHPQLVDLGFPAFVQQSSRGPLFLIPGKGGEVLGPLQGLKNRLAEFARAVVTDPHVAPNHGWRHRFKTVGMEAGIPPRILDAIQGQAPRTVADSYGDVTLKTVVAAISRLPSFALNEK